MTSAFLAQRDDIRQLMERIYPYRMTTTSGGNLSIRRSARRIKTGYRRTAAQQTEAEMNCPPIS